MSEPVELPPPLSADPEWVAANHEALFPIDPDDGGDCG